MAESCDCGSKSAWDFDMSSHPKLHVTLATHPSWKVLEDLGGERAHELMAARLERKRQAPLPSARLGSWPELRTLVKFPKRKWSTETWPEPRGAINHRD